MTVVIGTADGVYRASDAGFEDTARVLDGVKAYDVAERDGAWYVATVDGLYRSGDGASSWRGLDVPGEDTTAVGVSPDGSRVYAGTRPAALHVSRDEGRSWRVLDGLDDVPTRERWFNHVAPPNVRSVASHPDVPDRVVVGIDGGGVLVSEDGGETWVQRGTGITQYVHDVLVRGPDEYVAATDAGLFGTRDGGRWWDYLFTKRLKHRYFRGVFEADGVLFAGGARSTPGAWKEDGTADAGLYRVRWDERTPEIERVSYPGEPDELVDCGVSVDGRPVAGTTGGRLLAAVDGSWRTADTIPGGPEVRTMAVG